MFGMESNSQDEDTDILGVCLSATSKDALEEILKKFGEDIDVTEASISDIAYTYCCRRDHLKFRTLLAGKNKGDLVKECQLKRDELHAIHPVSRRNIVFVYCGTGTAWTGMCREMLQKNYVFRQSIREIDAFLFPLTGWKIEDRLSDSACMDDPFLSHIATFANQIALTEVWKSFAILPDRIVGQSAGEVAAAYASGHLSLENAVHVAYHRSNVLSQYKDGAMLGVENVSIDIVKEFCDLHSDKVTFAGYNSPTACTLAGSTENMREVREKLRSISDKIFIKDWGVKCPYHSPLLHGCQEKILKSIEKFDPCKSTQIPLISTATGELATRDDFLTGRYWFSNIVSPVLLMQAIRKASIENALNIYIELGPRPVLRHHLSQILSDDRKGVCLASMQVRIELPVIWATLTELYQFGCNINWTGCFREQNKPAALSGHAFNKPNYV